MSVHFISGKPGGGKSMYAVKLLISELRHTTRNVVTNLALDLPRLAEYLANEYGNTFNMGQRIRILDESEVGEFWLHPAKGCDIVAKIEIRIRGGKVERPDFAIRAETGGTAYFLDEIHLQFNARNWQATGDECLFYLSQHRKLGDDVICITQHVGNVDKQFRSVTQDYTYLRNLKKERLGLFRMMPVFLRSTFSQPATGAPGEKAMETGSFTLDVAGLASCYYTAVGTGIHNRGEADSQVKAKGLSIGWLIAGVVVVLGLASQFPKLMAYAINGKAKSTPVAVTEHKQLPVATNPPVPPRQLATQEPKLQEPQRERRTNSPARYVTTSVKLNGRWTVLLSDGSRWVQGEDLEFEALGKRGAVIGGEVIEWAKPNPAAAGKNFGPSVSQNGTVIYGPEPAARKVAIGNIR